MNARCAGKLHIGYLALIIGSTANNVPKVVSDINIRQNIRERFTGAFVRE